MVFRRKNIENRPEGYCNYSTLKIMYRLYGLCTSSRKEIARLRDDSYRCSLNHNPS